MGFTERDRQKQDDMVRLLKKQTKVIKQLKGYLRQANDVIHKQSLQINDLRREHNLTNYRLDTQQQYGRKNSMRVLNLDNFKDMDPEEIIFEIAKEIEKKTKDDENKVEFNISSKDIERCHFLGGEKSTRKKKLICKFGSYKMRMKFIKNKRLINSQTSGKFKEVFICEDLTPLRSRLIWFIKENFSHKFCSVHTMNGIIRMKKDQGNEEATKNSPWLSVSNVDEFYALLDHTDLFDINKFNDGLHGFKILPQIAIEPLDFDMAFLNENSDFDSQSE